MLYELVQTNASFYVPLGFIALYRWLIYIIKLIAFCSYKPIFPREKPRYACFTFIYPLSRYTMKDDVTVIVPTIDADSHLHESIATWLSNDPFEIIFVYCARDLIRN